MFKSITRLRVGTVRRDGAAAVCGRRKLNALYRAPTVSRHFATDASSTPPPHPTSTTPPPKGGIRISTLFYGLILIGVASTAFGLYELYQMFTMWPEELRSDLRAALRAKYDDNPKLSAKHFQKAYDAARTLDVVKFGAEPYLKISGIALALADALERANRPSSAFDAYKEAYDLLRAHASSLSDRERLRGAVVAHKLGELAAEYSLGDEEEERWRVAAVEDGLRVARAAAAGASANDSGDEENARVVLADLDLPRWLTTEDVGAPIEALGAFYARTGRVDWALALYLQAVSLLVPPEGSGKKGKPEDVCRGAQMMNNLSELILRGKLTPEKIHQAESWARKALAVIETTRGGAGYYADMSMCDQATVVTLFNLATIREMDSDNKSAKDLFKQALDKSARIGYQDGTAHAQLALQRLARIERGATLTARAPPPSTNP